MVLAAGRGERMRPLTFHRAKPALPVLNRPLLAHALERFARAGVRRVAINLHHLPETVRQVAEEWAPPGLELVFFHEEEILGTGGGIRNAAAVLRDGPFLLSNGDFLLQMDPAEAVATHRRSGASATLALVPFQEHMSYTPVFVADGRITRFGEPHADERAEGDRFMFTGLHVVEPSVLERIPAGRPLGIVRPVYTDILAEGGIIAAHVTEGAWFEFGTPADYLRRSLRLLSEPYRGFVDELGVVIDGEGEDARALGRDVRISEGAGRIAATFLGDGCAVGKDASLEESIVARNAVIPYGCALSRCIIAEDVILPPGCRLDHRIVLPRAGDDLSRFPGAQRLENLVHFPL